MSSKLRGCVGIIARLGSKRLKNKHLLKIDGQAIIVYLIERIKIEFSQEIDRKHLEIFILTGDSKTNKELVEIGVESGISTYCGHDTNIPLRMHQLTKNKNFDFIISIDGDDVLCAPEGMREVYKSILKGNKYVKTINYPFGMNSMGITNEFLLNSLKDQGNKSLETGWGWIFDENECEIVDGRYNKDERLRFTLDYIEDFSFFKKIILSDLNIMAAKTKSIINHVIHNNYFIENMHINKKYWENFDKQQAEEIRGVYNG